MTLKNKTKKQKAPRAVTSACEAAARLSFQMFQLPFGEGALLAVCLYDGSQPALLSRFRSVAAGGCAARFIALIALCPGWVRGVRVST